MKLVSSSGRKASAVLRLAASLALVTVVPLLLHADGPSWWSQRGVLVETAAPDEYAPANQGQLRNIAKAAANTMDSRLPGGAGDAIHALIESWATPSNQRNDFAPLNIGQLKQVAKPFYDRLIAAGLATQYPWATTTTAVDDFAVANIGQVKNLFSFEVPAIDPLYDGDNDGLPDAWERQFFNAVGVDPNADPDGDGSSNQQEYLQHTDPTDFFNGTLVGIAVTGGGDQRGDPGTLLPLPVSIRVSSAYYFGVDNAPVSVVIEKGGARLVPDNSGTTSPSVTLTLRANAYDANGYPVAQFYVLLPSHTDVSIIRASAQGGARAVSVSTTAVTIDPSLVAPTNLSVTATSRSTATLTWTEAANASPTTVQASVDGGKTWITLGTVAAGISSASVTGLSAGHTTKFRLFSGGTPSGNGTFALPGPASGPPSPPDSGGGGTGDSADVEPLEAPVVEIDQAEYFYLANDGYPGLSQRGRLYKSKKIVVMSDEWDMDGIHVSGGSTTQTFTWIPGHQSYGQGGHEVTSTSVTGDGGHFDVPYDVVISTDSMLRLETTGLLFGSTSSKTITLSDPYTDADADAAGAAADLQFYGEFYEQDTGRAFDAVFQHGGGHFYIVVTKYRFRVNADPNAVVTWDIRFTPETGGPVQHDIQSWHGDGSTHSPEYQLDPRLLHGGQNGSYKIVLISAELMVDANRDGKIDDADRAHVTKDAPWRWWVNDDDDSGDTGGTDVSRNGAGANFETTFAHPDSTNTGVVDGTRDLIDFFPIYLNIKSLLDVLPPTDGFTYNLKQESGNANFVYTDLRASAAFDYLHKLTGNANDNAATLGGGSQATGAITRHVTSEGVALDPKWLQRFDDEGFGVLLVEARARTDKPIVLQVFSSAGHKMVEFELPVSFSPVDEMFRHKNLMGADNTTGGQPDYATGDDTLHGEPENYPDSLCNNSYFVFVHGYNVNPNDARGWNAEMFKRLHQSGSKAKFVGVTWNGAETQIPGMDVTVNYHKNVDHAFQTAQGTDTAVGFATYIQNLGNVVIAAHSLGNVVVASAICDWHANVGRLFMIDAAISSEVLDPPTGPFVRRANMIHPEWLDYPQQAYATDWYKLFLPDDARRRLTWRGRFQTLGPNVFNFYSSGEEVLAEHANTLGDPSIFDVAYTREGFYLGKFAWALQEKLKGRIRELQSFPLLGSVYGGWGFTHNIGHPPHTPAAAEVATMTDSSFQTQPIFDPGFDLIEHSPGPADPSGYVSVEPHGPTWIIDLTDPSKGSDIAASHSNTLLTEMFPATTLPIGSTFQPSLGQENNFDMQTEFKESWPAERQNEDWRHSDLKQVAYPFVFRLFDRLVELGKLNL
jgi:hypothetical protein